MTFPNTERGISYPPEVEEAAVTMLAGGPGASRAALYSARTNFRTVMTAFCQAFDTHACQTLDASTFTEPDKVERVSYGAVPKLERESGGDKSGTWRTTPEGAQTNIAHDHAMCDPDRNCGPAEATLEDWRNGKTTTARLMAKVDAEHADAAAMERLKAAEAFYKESVRYSPVWTQAEADKLREDLRCTPAEAMRPAIDTINGIRDSLPFYPGGRMWAENNPEDYIDRPKDSLPLTAYRYEPDIDARIHDEGCESGADDCCAPGDGGCPGTDPAYARTDPEDKLRIIADIVGAQAPLGSDLANFRRRLALILDMQ